MPAPTGRRSAARAFQLHRSIVSRRLWARRSTGTPACRQAGTAFLLRTAHSLPRHSAPSANSAVGPMALESVLTRVEEEARRPGGASGVHVSGSAGAAVAAAGWDVRDRPAPLPHQPDRQRHPLACSYHLWLARQRLALRSARHASALPRSRRPCAGHVSSLLGAREPAGAADLLPLRWPPEPLPPRRAVPALRHRGPPAAAPAR